MSHSEEPRAIEVVAPGANPSAGVELLAVPVRPGQVLAQRAAALDAELSGPLSRLVEAGFSAKAGETRLFFSGLAETPHLLAVGVGEGEGLDAENARRVAGKAVQVGRIHSLVTVGVEIPPLSEEDVPAVAQAAAEGLCLGDWAYEDLRRPGSERVSPPAPQSGVIFLGSGQPASAGDAAGRGRTIAECQNFARMLVTLPGNIATPSYLEERAQELGERYGLRVEGWGPERLRSEGFGSLLAVAAGSRVEPRFIVLEHQGTGGAPTVLVGKGVTFDSGGISIKPASGMEDMKYDMAGAAAVLGAMRAVAELDLPLRVIGLIPATENLPSGTALKPGDVIRGLSGTSIEVINTDAEGRLILSDALAFATRLEPAAIVDLATLTGACVVALGRHAMGLMASDDALAKALKSAGERTGERVWRLPLWPEYRRQLDSDIADIKNSGGRDAGTITAGWFLRDFVDETPWVHLDMAGVAWAEKVGPYQPKGATGAGVRLLVEWLSSAD
ncbi:MAG: leucyl aminopeptidase [Gemmatimonadota bacterium]